MPLTVSVGPQRRRHRRKDLAKYSVSHMDTYRFEVQEYLRQLSPVRGMLCGRIVCTAPADALGAGVDWPRGWGALWT